MPNRRRAEEGSFAGKLDELVIHFPPDRPALKFESAARSKRPKRRVRTPACVNRALLDDSN
jgi:hypothetical protein